MQDRLPFSGFVANFDGKQIQNKEELFRFLEKNVGLPDANNWSSITNWLTDLSWIKAEEYNFILENYDSFLKDDLSSKDLFLEILEEDILPCIPLMLDIISTTINPIQRSWMYIVR